MFKKYRAKLDELIEYTSETNNRVDDYKAIIATRKEKVEELEQEYAKGFISGEKVNNQNLRKLKEELEQDKRQLELIENTVKKDIKARRLANEVYQEFIELGEQRAKANAKLRGEIEKLEKELEQKKREAEKAIEINTRKEKAIAKERLLYADLMNISTRELNRLASRATGYQYHDYIKRFGKESLKGA